MGRNSIMKQVGFAVRLLHNIVGELCVMEGILTGLGFST
jgi:hypothetical protein